MIVCQSQTDSKMTYSRTTNLNWLNSDTEKIELEVPQVMIKAYNANYTG